MIKEFLQSTSPHVNCLRCFEQLYTSDRPARAEFYNARMFLKGRSLPGTAQ